MVKLRLGAGATIVLLSIAVSVAGPVQATAPMATAQSMIAAFTLIVPNGTTPSARVARAIVPSGMRWPALTTVHSGGRVKSTHMKQLVPSATTSNRFQRDHCLQRTDPCWSYKCSSPDFSYSARNAPTS